MRIHRAPSSGPTRDLDRVKALRRAAQSIKEDLNFEINHPREDTGTFARKRQGRGAVRAPRNGRRLRDVMVDRWSRSIYNRNHDEGGGA